MTSVLSMRPRTIVPGVVPSSTSIASGRLPSVALRPQITSPGFQRLRRASASCTWTPRLFPISSCHSSTTTVCTPDRSSRAVSRVSIRLSDSGVVTSTVGNRRSWRARSLGGVSPVRMPTVQFTPRSVNGERKAWVESAASARIGVSHNTPSGGGCAPSEGIFNTAARASAPNHTA